MKPAEATRVRFAVQVGLMHMALFFLHVANDYGIDVDERGHEFADAQAAIAEAGRAAGDMLAQDLREGSRSISLKVYVQDARHAHLATVTVSGSLSTGQARA